MILYTRLRLQNYLFPLFRQREEMDASKLLGIIAIATGLLGAVLNSLLYWVINRNRSIDKKCALVYQNLAAVDIFNCFVIPLCYLTLKGHRYDYNPTETSNSILYLLFGGTVNIPYLMLILLSVARVMIFKYQMSYTRRLRLLYLRILCLACWVLSIGSGVGIWLCCLLTGTAKYNVLINLMKVQTVATQILVVMSIALIVTSLVLLHTLIHEANKDNNSGPSTSMTESPFLTTHHILLKELSSARRTFSYFLVSVIICSSFPFTFGLTFSLCGPNFNSTSTTCKILQVKEVVDPKFSYAITLLSLCGMSIANSIILLRQKSFKSVLCNMRIVRQRCVFTEHTHTEPQPGCAHGTRNTVVTTKHEGAPETLVMSSPSEF